MEKRIIRLLGVLTVLSLLMAPAISELSSKGCTCMSGDCCNKYVENCGKSSDNSIPTSCVCPCQVVSFSAIEYCNLSYSYFGKSSSRSNTQQGASSTATSSGASIFSLASPAVHNNGGQPDLDVVEYLPPSAKQIFNILASDGPLTQKELIRKADLPPRTVRYALSKLKEEDLLEERFFFRDARQSLYSLNGRK